ncbi:amidohydrolase family protein [Acidobacteria bacterium AH-259-O06]|nr:amidohydrolase family protein [Acidobacteria bacterium AH-259-O06]
MEKGEAVYDELAELADCELVKGVRRVFQSEPDPEFCLQPSFLKAVKTLPEFDFSFDICIYHIQMSAAVQLVQRCPEVKFVLDHVGKPALRDHLLEPWRRHIKNLASLPNVWCKISGMVTEADHESWQKEHLKPYIDHVFECFGSDRVMFGGDWPVLRLATDYENWVETLREALAGASKIELRKLFKENAERFYRV